MSGKPRDEKITWDEQNLADNELDAEQAQRQKILEPKTPFHTLEDDGETPTWNVPKAAPAVAAGPSNSQPKGLLDGVDLSALAGKALERREDFEEDDEVEKKRKFEENRKKHYNMGTKGGLAVLRAQAAALDEEEDEDD